MDFSSDRRTARIIFYSYPQPTNLLASEADDEMIVRLNRSPALYYFQLYCIIYHCYYYHCGAHFHTLLYSIQFYNTIYDTTLLQLYSAMLHFVIQYAMLGYPKLVYIYYRNQKLQISIAKVQGIISFTSELLHNYKCDTIKYYTSRGLQCCARKFHAVLCTCITLCILL